MNYILFLCSIVLVLSISVVLGHESTEAKREPEAKMKQPLAKGKGLACTNDLKVFVPGPAICGLGGESKVDPNKPGLMDRAKQSSLTVHRSPVNLRKL